MAREIKIVRQPNGELNVRNIPDALASGEEVVAARWQDDGAKYIAASVGAEIELFYQAGALGEESTPRDLGDYVIREWGEDAARKALA